MTNFSRPVLFVALAVLAMSANAYRVARACEDALETSRPYAFTGRGSGQGDAPSGIAAESISMAFVPVPDNDSTGCASEPTTRNRCASAAGLLVEFAEPIDPDTPTEELGYRVASVGSMHPEFVDGSLGQADYYADDGVIALAVFRLRAASRRRSPHLDAHRSAGQRGSE